MNGNSCAAKEEIAQLNKPAQHMHDVADDYWKRRAKGTTGLCFTTTGYLVGPNDGFHS
jgi:hypothetical protein